MEFELELLDAEGIAELSLTCRDTSSGKLDDAVQLGADAGKSPGNEIRPELNNFAVLIKTDNINGDRHEESMDTGRRRDPKPFSGV